MSSPKVYCLYCSDIPLPHVRALQQHSSKFHPTVPKLYFKAGSDTRRCPHCLGTYPTMTEAKFLNHCRSCVNNPERAKNSKEKFLFSCPICERTITRRSNLKAHLKKMHSDQKPSELSVPPPVKIEKGNQDFTLFLHEFVDGTLDPSHLVLTDEVQEYDTRILGTKATKISFRFSKLALQISMAGMFQEVIESVFYYLADIHGAEEDDIISTSLDSEYLAYPVSTALSKSAEFQVQNLLDRLDAVMQSYHDLPAQADLTINFTSLNPARILLGDDADDDAPRSVSGRKNLNPKDFAHIFQYLERKRGYLDVALLQSPHNDHACLPLCLAVALHFGQDAKKTSWWRFRKDFPEEVVAITREIYQLLGQDYNTEIVLTSSVLGLLQNWLSTTYGKNIRVFLMRTDVSRDTELFYNGGAENSINLLIAQNHVGLIDNTKLFFNRIEFCERCLTFVKKWGGKHSCSANKKCHLCHSSNCRGPDDGSRSLLCLKCDRRFKNEQCLTIHLTQSSLHKSTICESYYKCSKCFKSVWRHRPHKCGVLFCKTCRVDAAVNTPLSTNHRCFVSTTGNDRANSYNQPIHLVYDIECRREDGKLVAILLIVFRSCPNCFAVTDPHRNTECCGRRCHAFKGKDCLELAVDYIFFSGFEKAIAIAHFGSGFDSLYILETLLRLGHVPKLVNRGNKILKLEFNKVVLIDSLMFFHARLAKLPDLFGFSQKKTFFPHDFVCDLDYVGPWPDRSCFPGSKTEPEFDRWFVDQKRQFPVFDYMQQLEIYCLQDVLVLHASVSKFRSLVLEYANCEPFQIAITLASLAGNIFRFNFVLPRTIAVLNDNRDLADRSQSRIGGCFLRWIQETKYNDLQFALNGQEVKFGPYKVDGFSPSAETAVEFYGCHWHACLKPEHKISPATKHPSFPYYSFEDVNQINFSREKAILNHGVVKKMEVYWECETEKMADFQSWLAETKMLHLVTNPINSLREALYGGRVEVSLPLVEILTESGYTIKYKDANHLYPSVMMKCPFPTGHPTLINGWEVENFGQNFSAADCDRYFGIIKVQIFYPSDAPMLFHGILPFHNNEKKLVFGLCAACAEENRQNKFCDHSTPSERAWIGAYCSTELKLALENNYKIIRVFQILHFDQVSNSVFSKFMVHFLKLKFSASGYPKEYTGTAESRNHFLKMLHDLDGISLAPEEVYDPANAPLKTLSKYLVNALWGKMAENRDNSSSEVHFVNTTKQWRSVILNDAIAMVGASYLPYAQTFLVETKKKTNFTEPSFLSNAVIGSFVTSHARCVLTANLLKLSFRALYCDTDSIIYYLRETDTDPIKTGPFSHQWKDEVPEGLKNFAGLCPKNYIYETSDGKCKWTCKGLSLGSAAAKAFTFPIAKSYLLQRCPEICEIYEAEDDAAAAEPPEKLAKMFYDKIENEETRDMLKSAYSALGPDFLVFDDGIRISRDWKRPGGAFKITEKNTKMIRAKFDKRTVFCRKDYMLDSIVKIRSVPFGTTEHEFKKTTTTSPFPKTR